MIAKSVQCFAGAESCVGSHGNIEGTPFEFDRTAAGWVTHSLAPPASSYEADQPSLFSAETHKLLFSAAKPAGSGSYDFYARDPDGSIADVGPVAESPRPPGGNILDLGGLPNVVATSDLSHMVYATEASEWAFDTSFTDIAAPGLYEYDGDDNTTPRLVSVTGGRGSTDLVSRCGSGFGNLQLQINRIYGPLSHDGRTIYFTATGGTDNGVEPCVGSGANEGRVVPAAELYARVDGELGDAHTVLISAPTAASCTSVECRESTAAADRLADTRDAEFEGASSDGTSVFFTSTQQLTDEASQDGEAVDSAQACHGTMSGDSGCNLYVSRCPEPCGEAAEEPSAGDRSLIDVSAGAKNEGGPRVQGAMAISPDGSHVYFVAQGSLTEAANARGEKAEDGADNLYAYATGRPLAYVTTLTSADEADWRNGPQFANVTPDGRFLVFESHGALTADNTRPEGPTQIYRYDAETGALVRISIGDDGFNDDDNTGSGEANIARNFLSIEQGFGSYRADPTMSHDGEYVFFESTVALTPGALNEVVVDEHGRLAENIYEYHDGHVFLISDGKDANQGSEQVPTVKLLGSDASGHNVFFTTDDPLVPEDTNTERDFYDAHACSAEEPCLAARSGAATPCSEETCHGQAAGSSGGQPLASESVTGPGNLAAPVVAAHAQPKPLTKVQKLARALKICRAKRSRTKRAHCERLARRQYAAGHTTSVRAKRRAH
jgi:hypothetical protein